MIVMSFDSVRNPTEREKLEELFGRYAIYVKRMAEKYFPELVAESDDVVQKVFMLVIKKRRLFINADDLMVRGLLYDFTHSVCVDTVRKKVAEQKSLKRLFSGGKSEVDLSLNPEAVYQKKIHLEKMKNVINNLPYPAGEIIIKKYYLGMGNKEIAEIMGLTETNVGTILQRTLKKIKNEMEGE